MEKLRIHSASYMFANRLKYTGDGDAVRCKDGGLEVSGLTSNMNPFDIHSKQRPNCSFVCSISLSASMSSLTIANQNTLLPNEEDNPSKCPKIQRSHLINLSNILLETELLQQIRGRSFSHWPHQTIPSSAQMIEAGFFPCNVGDRVICIYCNIICQQWTSQTDDPCEVHKTLSPNCVYVKAKLIDPSDSSIIVIDERSTVASSNNQLPTSTNLDPLRSNQIVFTAACNPAYAELTKRHASFATWPNENLPSLGDLVRAGFFYSGTKTKVTCFYCNGSLQNWEPNDNPMMEHARWFPHCAYARQLCGDELYQKIQESKRTQQERATANELSDKAASDMTTNTNITKNSRRLLILDESTLSRLVAARLDLPISQRLLDQNFKLSIIKRCWEDQLRLKQDDFVSECDLYVACLILQKQIEYIESNTQNVVIPSIKMKQLREQKEEARRKMMNFTEERHQTIKRGKSLCHWPHSSPAPSAIFTAGWLYDKTKGRDYTMCPYCGIEYDNWQPKDNPWTIHGQLSSFCPYLLAARPIHINSVKIKSLDEVFTKEKINHEIGKSTSLLISTTTSRYGLPPQREQSFSKFPGGFPNNIEALVGSGFYFTGIGTMIQCYDCQGRVNDFLQYASDEINARHRSQFPHCRFAQLLPQQSETTAIHSADQCKWCLVNLKELVTYPCMHLAVCRSCTQWISWCPICGIEGEAFMKLYM